MASNNHDDFFGGIFDFNGDGKTSLDEQFIAFKIFEEISKESENETDDYSPSFDYDDYYDDLDEALDRDFDEGYSPAPAYHFSEPNKAANSSATSVPVSASLPHIPVTKENYHYQMRSEIKAILVGVLFVTFLMLIPSLILSATISVYDPKNSASGFVTFVLGGGSIVAMCVILYIFWPMFQHSFCEIKLFHEEYLEQLTEEEKQLRAKKNRKRIIVIASVLLLIIGAYSGVNISKYISTNKQYAQAVALYEVGDYDAALEQFSLIEDSQDSQPFKESSAYISICRIHNLYNRGNLSSAYFEIMDLKYSALPTYTQQEIDVFKEALKVEYKIQSEKDSIAEAQAYRDRISNGVPYVGMFESEINNTSLGRADDKIRHNYECINGEQYLANLYDFKVNNHTIFTARCVQGKVTQIWDNRDSEPITITPVKKPSSSSSDPYNAASYSNEEDFYDDHYDDFFDYYDAEQYWRDHRG